MAKQHMPQKRKRSPKEKQKVISVKSEDNRHKRFRFCHYSTLLCEPENKSSNENLMTIDTSDLCVAEHENEFDR
jgi:hypothetical protein